MHHSPHVLASGQSISAWLLPCPSPEPALNPGLWYESLYVDRSRAEDKAFEALRWVLNVLPCRALVVQAQDMMDGDTLAVPASDELAVAVASRATALFLLTGAFTMEQAQALIEAPHERLLRCAIEAPANVLTPAQEAKSRFGPVSRGGRVWCWEQTPAHPAVVAGAIPEQGLLRANTDAEAIDRLREHFTEARPFQWINRRDFVLLTRLGDV